MIYNNNNKGFKQKITTITHYKTKEKKKVNTKYTTNTIHSTK